MIVGESGKGVLSEYIVSSKIFLPCCVIEYENHNYAAINRRSAGTLSVVGSGGLGY